MTAVGSDAKRMLAGPPAISGNPASERQVIADFQVTEKMLAFY